VAVFLWYFGDFFMKVLHVKYIIAFWETPESRGKHFYNFNYYVSVIKFPDEK
jgi:hypothetical protein